MKQHIIDLHIHSHHSRATSKHSNIEGLYYWAKIKGINVLGTGDFTHPAWFAEMSEKLQMTESGLYKLKSEIAEKIDETLPKSVRDIPVRFVLTVEISNIYSKGGKVRKLHNCIVVPNFSVASYINSRLDKIGNLKADGRPILGMDSKNLLEITLQSHPDSLFFPAHIWTPWFAMFGSRSGFDSIKEAFEDLAPEIKAVETGLSCYDEKTEVLTGNGWKKFKDVTYKDTICTLKIDTTKIEYQKPTKIYTHHYNGKMYRLKTRRVDLFVTPNHNLLYSHCDFRKTPKFYLRKAELLFNKSKRFKKDGIWKGKDEKYFILPAAQMKHGSRFYSGTRYKKAKRFPIKLWLKFFGFWIAEGWTNTGKDGSYAVFLANKDEEMLLTMKELLEKFGYRVYWDKKINNTIRVRDYQLFHYLRQFGKSSDKYIPSEVKSLSKELIEVFFKYYIKGDGHRYGRRGKGLSATTISTKLRDDLQEIALKMGMSAYYKLDRKKGMVIVSLSHTKEKVYRQSKDSWVVYFIRKNLYTVLPSTIKKYNNIEAWTDFNSLVYCVTIPNRVLYIRRNGIPVWCGNSDPFMNWRLDELQKVTILSNSDAHSPQKLGREASIIKSQMNYKDIISAIKTNDERMVGTIEFFPQEGKYHFDGHRICNFSCSPTETKKLKGICPKCKRPLVVGVDYRVDEIADHPEKYKPTNHKKVEYIIPLPEIISEMLKVGVQSKTVQTEYEKIYTKLGNEFDILRSMPIEKIQKAGFAELADVILRMRNKDVYIEPGYDGVFGKIKLFKSDSERTKTKDQMSLL